MFPFSHDLYEAVHSRDWIRVMQLANANVGIRFSHLNWTPLHIACEKVAPVQLMKLLIEKGMAINGKTNEECTPYI